MADSKAPAPALIEFTKLLDSALHHARCAHAVRDRSDRENTQRIHDEARRARQAVIDYVAAD
jgi:hypothetical protein